MGTSRVIPALGPWQGVGTRDTNPAFPPLRALGCQQSENSTFSESLTQLAGSAVLEFECSRPRLSAPLLEW